MSKELIEQRNKALADARALIDDAEQEGRKFTPEDDQKWEGLMNEADELKARIERSNKLAEEENAGLEIIETRAGQFDTEERTEVERTEKSKADENVAFRNWVCGGMSALTAEERSLMEQRAQSVGTTTAGGFTVPEDFRRQLEDAMLQFGGMRQSRASVLTTATGADLPMPTSNDTAQAGEILAENTAVNEQDITFGQTVLNAYKYSSKLIRVSQELLQDGAFDLNGFLARKLGERIGRITNLHFTTGTGTGQPSGIVTGSTVGKTGTTGQTTTVIYDDLVDLIHSVDPAYRQNAEFMFSDNTLAAIKKLKDSNGLPLFVPQVQSGGDVTARILGHSYVINQDVADMAANAKSILFGDMSKYMIRDVLGVQMVRLNERYADLLQVGFMAYSRHDGVLLDAGTNPVKYYANSAT